MILGIILLLLALPFSSMVTETLTAQTEPIKEVKEGDVIFQTSLSQQSPLIQMATRSKISHCGIIVIKDSGICTHNHIPFTLENLIRLWTENTRWKIKHILTYISGMRHSEQIRQMFFCSLNGMRSINFCI